MNQLRVAVVGGGPAGMMAAIAAAQKGHQVSLFEQNQSLGQKLLITGGRRCNLTTTVSETDFFARLIGSWRSLRPALSAWSQTDLQRFFRDRGVELKVEGQKVYPVSDRATDIRDCLVRELHDQGVKIELGQTVRQIVIEADQVTGIQTASVLPFDRVIVACGGISFPRTGSDGRLLYSLRQVKQVAWRPGLVSLVTKNDFRSLMGISLADAELSYAKRQLRGECLFSHRGLTGPLAMDFSSYLSDEPLPVTLTLDVIPDITRDELADRLFGPKKGLISRLTGLVPKRLLDYLLEPYRDQDLANLTKVHRQQLLDRFKAHPVIVTQLGSIDQAIISQGGVAWEEIKTKTLEHKKIKGLYFAGECLDIVGPTGGYNLQIAFSTGYLAGRNE